MSKYSIVTMEEVHSTNSYALENMQFLEDKTVIYTSHQTSGRGRFNRKWVADDSENIYMSVVLKPASFKNYPFPNLTQYLSVVLCQVLEKDFNLKPVIKWPNDILVNNCKISGILAESFMQNNEMKGIVLGLGLNVNMKEETLKEIDQNAISISLLNGKNNDCEKISRKICDVFFENYDLFVKQGFEFIREDYIKRCFFLGKNIKISENGTKNEYIAEAIDNDGFLTVRDSFGNRNKIITGDVLC